MQTYIYVDLSGGKGAFMHDVRNSVYVRGKLGAALIHSARARWAHPVLN